MASVGDKSAAAALPTAPLCERAEPPEVCQLSRNLLNLCETMGLSASGLRASCSEQLWDAHAACQRRLLTEGSGGGAALALCEDQSQRLLRNATARLAPEARIPLQQACLQELARLNRHPGAGSPDAWCRSVEERCMQVVVERGLVGV